MKSSFSVNIQCDVWYRHSTKEWVGETKFKRFGSNNCRVTGKTANEARNLMLATIAHDVAYDIWNEEAAAECRKIIAKNKRKAKRSKAK